MIKTLAFISSFLFLFIASNFFSLDNDVAIQPSVPESVKPGEEFLVELTVNKNNLSGFAYLQQYLPEGFSATPVETQNGKFLFEKDIVRFMWVELPKEASFKVSYKIKTDVTCNGLKTLNGEFSYIENDRTKRLAITPSVLHLTNEVEMPLADKSNEISKPKEEKNVDEENQLNQPVAEKGSSLLPEKKSPPVIPVYATIPAPQKGIYYKVQIAATKRSPDRNNGFFKSKYKIDDPVEISMHEGWKKYVMGTYDKYSVAKQHRNEAIAKIPDAFVVAYNNGQRIPLQEAIKASHRNQ